MAILPTGLWLVDETIWRRKHISSDITPTYILLLCLLSHSTDVYIMWISCLHEIAYIWTCRIFFGWQFFNSMLLYRDDRLLWQIVSHSFKRRTFFMSHKYFLAGRTDFMMTRKAPFIVIKYFQLRTHIHFNLSWHGDYSIAFWEGWWL